MINKDIMLDLSSLYSQPHRHYHNLSHINLCLGLLERYIKEQGLTLKRELEYAIWFHDAIYNPHSQENEENSAKLFDQYEKQYDLSCDGYLIRQLILGTKEHKSLDPRWDTEHNILNDIDLAILGQSPDVYSEYVFNIRKEYSFVTSEIFAKERIKFVKSFLEKDSIYKTPFFKDLFESNARSNLKTEHNEQWLYL